MSDFNFLDRDFLSLRDQLVDFFKGRVPEWTADANDLVYVLLEANAYMGDMLSYYVDRAARESNVLTATNPANVRALARLFGYEPSIMRAASMQIEVTSPEGLEEVYDGYVFVTQEPTPRYFTARVRDAAGNPSFVTASPTSPALVTVYEGFVSSEDLGISDGKPNQSYYLSSRSVASQDFVVHVGFVPDGVTVSGRPEEVGTYRYADYLGDAGPYDDRFGVVVNPDGSLSVQFGDGVSGRIPANGKPLFARYRVCSGRAGNGIKAGTVLRLERSPDSVTVLPMTAVAKTNSVGGTDMDSLDDIRQKVRDLAGTQRRAVTTGDYERIASAVSGVRASYVSSEVWSRPTVWVSNATNTPDPALEDSVRRRLTDVGLIGVDVDVRSGEVVVVPVSLEVTLWDSASQAAAEAAITKALDDTYADSRLAYDSPLSGSDIVSAVLRSLPSGMAQYARVTKFTVGSGIKDKVVADGPTSSDIVAVKPKSGYLLKPDVTLELRGGY